MLKTFANLVAVLLALYVWNVQADTFLSRQGTSKPMAGSSPLHDSHGAAAMAGNHVFMSAFAKSQAAAHNNALEQCRAAASTAGADCKVQFAFKNQCAVVMSHIRTKQFFWHISEPGVGKDETELQGLKDCYVNAGSVCATRRVQCSTHAQQKLSGDAKSFFDWLSERSDSAPSD